MSDQSITVRIARKVAEAEDVAVFELVREDGAELPPFSAGAHIDVEMRPGLIRQYSLCGLPTAATSYEIGVLKDPNGRGGSVAMHGLAEGQSLQISAPRNHFQLEPTLGRTLLFAGGIGVTPILAMAEQLAVKGAPFELHYNARSPERCAFHARLTASSFASRVHFHFDDRGDDQKLDIRAALGAPDADAHIYVCGPPGYISYVLDAATAQGFHQAQLHREYFAADTSARFAPGGAFAVKIASTGQILEIPADRSVLDVLRDNGVEAPSSCEQGVCGSCVTGVLEGVPEHRDFFLSVTEQGRNDQFTPCCSRSKTPLLVIDL